MDTLQLCGPGLTAEVASLSLSPRCLPPSRCLNQLFRSAAQSESRGTAWDMASSESSCPLCIQPKLLSGHPAGGPLTHVVLASVARSQWTTARKSLAWGSASCTSSCHTYTHMPEGPSAHCEFSFRFACRILPTRFKHQPFVS